MGRNDAKNTQDETDILVPIENVRTFLIIGLCGVLFLMWQAWQRDYDPNQTTQPAPTRTTEQGVEQPPVQSTTPDLPAIPDQPAQERETSVVIEEVTSNSVRVTTDLYALEMNAHAIHRLRLLEYPVSLEAPEEKFPLLNDSLPNIFTVESGILGSNGEPGQEAVFVSDDREYTLQEGMDVIEVRFSWEGQSGIRITRIYRFTRGSYVIETINRIENNSGAAWSGRMYGQFRRTEVPARGGLFRVYTYTGGIVSSPDKPYEKVDFDDMVEQPVARDIVGGWAAMIQHYFAAAWAPDIRRTNHYYSKVTPDTEYILGLYYDQPVAPGASEEMSLSAYIGPKIQENMEAVAPGLRRTVDYGWLFFLAQPMFVVLSWIFGLVKNWGWTIIIFTILLKTCFYWLSAKSYQSMARMRKLQPRVLQLRERYGSDKQRMNQAMMVLYRKEKINPLGGCLPIVVQIPFFISLYWVLLESVELRQAPFIFWLTDLAQHDPFFVLPIAMGASMYIQQKLNPAPPDPMQAKIMMMLPFVFTFFFLFFPSGLVLYWLVNNVLSIAQQWMITKRIEAGG